MIDSKPFGDLYSELLEPGDIVNYRIWNKETSLWEKKFGIVIKIKNQILSNRLVSVSEVYVYEEETVKEFFTLTLIKVNNNEEFSGSHSPIG
jgi:hypothetical protein